MKLQKVEWLLVVYYGKSAHQATYGRLPGRTYTKDYIQLSRRTDFISDLESAFPDISAGAQSVPIEFHWPSGRTTGKIFRRSSDRPHLSWETNSAPPPWKMSPHPSDLTVETILGNPSHTAAIDADSEFENLKVLSFGQPYLVAVKLEGDPRTIHLRVMIKSPLPGFEWADLTRAPQVVQDLAGGTSQGSALAWKLFNPNDKDTPLFNPNDKVNSWVPAGAATTMETSTGKEFLTPNSLSVLDSDTYAESLPASDHEVLDLERLAESGIYAVSDSTSTVKTRGSAQKVFSAAVRKNYGNSCALTGITNREFLVASHIVPWSIDETIRLDPSNGICLSLIMDKAFECGFLIINDDLSVAVQFARFGRDKALIDLFAAVDGKVLTAPKEHPPNIEYLRRRRLLSR